MKSSGRVGILGGTFDPVHVGHLDAAEAAATALGLDRVLLLPSYTPPHRVHQPRASVYERFAMVAIACLSRDMLLASDLELEARDTSYTADTLRRLHARGYGAEQLFFITGADAFAEIATWRDYPRLLHDAYFAAVSRPNYPAHRLRAALPELAGLMRDIAVDGGSETAMIENAAPSSTPPSIFLIDARTAPVSSTEIRKRLALQESIAHLVPPDVESYIRRHCLYQAERLHGQD